MKIANSIDLVRIAAFPKGKIPWHIDWLGDVEFRDRAIRRQQPSISVHLSRVTDPEALLKPELLIQPRATDFGKQQCCRRVSVGTLPILRIGDVWRDQKLLLRPDYQLETFRDLRIDRSTATLVKAGVCRDNRGFLLPLAEHPWHGKCTQSYCVEVKLNEGRRLIIPCIELIRFYFGSSSGLISKLFLPPLSKEALYSHASFDRLSGHLSLMLGEGISGTSASDIGRLCLDSHAWRSAAYIGTSMLRASVAREPIYPCTFFPFEGSTDLVACGKWVSLGKVANSTFVVFSLRSCSHRFPFSSLKYKKSPEGERSSFEGRFKTPLQARSLDNSQAESQGPSLVERDASNRLSAASPISRFERPFPDLIPKRVWRSKASPTSKISSFAKPAVNTVDEAAVGDPVSDNRVRPIEIAIGSTSDTQLPQFLSAVAEELKNLEGIDVSLLTAGEQDGWTIPLPEFYDQYGDLDPGLYTNDAGGAKRLRLASVFRLCHDKKQRYLTIIEAEPAFASFEEFGVDLEDILMGSALKMMYGVANGETLPSNFEDALATFGPSLQELVSKLDGSCRFFFQTRDKT
jgi:hypothetical protein